MAISWSSETNGISSFVMLVVSVRERLELATLMTPPSLPKSDVIALVPVSVATFVPAATTVAKLLLISTAADGIALTGARSGTDEIFSIATFATDLLISTAAVGKTTSGMDVLMDILFKRKRKPL